MKIRNIFENISRSRWKEEFNKLSISSRYISEELRNNYTYILDDDICVAFISDHLDPDYVFPFNIGDIISLNNIDGYFVIMNLPLLDKRNMDYLKENISNLVGSIIDSGSIYSLCGVLNDKIAISDDYDEDGYIINLPIDQCIDLNMKKIDMELIEGEFLYYVREFALGHIEFKLDIVEFVKKNNIDISLHSIDHKSLFESNIIKKG